MAVTAAVIPVHNEAQTIAGIVATTRTHVDRVIVVDDGSTDETCAALEGLDVQLIRHAERAGKGHRLLEGLQAAFAGGASHAIALDGDGQHDPADIPEFLSRSAANPAAIILGDRSSETRKMPFARAFGNRFGSFFVSWACARKLRDAQCGMRVYPERLLHDVDVPAAEIDGFLFETAILLRAAAAGYPFVTVPIPARYEGFVRRKSHFDPLKDFLRIAALVTRFLLRHRLRLRGLLVCLQIVAETHDQPQERIQTCGK
jgi:glycosyltransferase involved in cell wall biosynthesis